MYLALNWISVIIVDGESRRARSPDFTLFIVPLTQAKITLAPQFGDDSASYLNTVKNARDGCPVDFRAQKRRPILYYVILKRACFDLTMV